MDNRKKTAGQILGLAVACVLICCGVWRGEAGTVLNKAINICFECIGLG